MLMSLVLAAIWVQTKCVQFKKEKQPIIFTVKLRGNNGEAALSHIPWQHFQITAERNLLQKQNADKLRMKLAAAHRNMLKLCLFRCCWEQWGDETRAEKCPITGRQSGGGDNQWNGMR